MTDLTRAFESAGFEDVRTYIQSGNVVFDAVGTDHAGLARRIEKTLLRSLGEGVVVVPRTLAEIESVVDLDPFESVKAGTEVKRHVTFLSKEPARPARLPLFSPRKDVEIIRIRGGDVFSVSHMRDGRFGFPNAFIEREFGAPATTRNWKTVASLRATRDRVAGSSPARSG